MTARYLRNLQREKVEEEEEVETCIETYLSEVSKGWQDTKV